MKESLRNSLFPFSLFLLPFILINATKLIVPCILLLVLSSFLQRGYTKLKDLPIALILLSVFFFMHIAGLAFTENMQYALKDLETKLSFLLFPIIYLISGAENISKNISWAKKGIVYGSSFAMINSMVISLYCQFTGGSACWSISNFGFQMHGTYLTAIYLLGGVFLLFDQSKSKGQGYFRLLYFSLLILSLILIQSLSSLLCALIISVFLFIKFTYNLKSKVIKYTLICIPLVMFIGVFQHKRIGEEIKLTTNIVIDYINDNETFVQEHVNAESSSEVRMVLYSFSLDLLGEHPFGVGTGDVKDELYKKYKAFDYTHFIEKKYNPHSQFFQSGIALGIISIIVLLLILLIPIINIKKYQHKELAYLCIIVFISCLFESFLERQVGVIFFSFALFFLSIPQKSIVK